MPLPALSPFGSGPRIPGAPGREVRLRAKVPGIVHVEISSVDTVHGDRSVVRVRVGRTEKAGALSPRDGETIAAAAHVALAERLPVIVELSSTGADIGEGLAALHGWGQAAQALTACSGVVPMVIAVDGPAVSGPALLLGLADHVVMTTEAYAFVSGPHMVRQFTGVPIDQRAARAGRAATPARAAWPASSSSDADGGRRRGRRAVRLPAVAQRRAAAASSPPTTRPTAPPRRPATSSRPPRPGATTCARWCGRWPTTGELLELKAAWAPNLVTAFGSIAGQPVGIVANQPCALAGTLDIPASQKGARFVAFCDAFNIPLVTLVDTPGFYPGKDLEWRGMIRHGAQMAFAYARATVPRVNVTLRKSYGGAYIVMDSKDDGQRPGPGLAHRRDRGDGRQGRGRDPPPGQRLDERAALEQAYEERLLNPYIAAERGLIDAVIDPADTRRELAAALEVLVDKREHLAPRSHDNTPL